MCVCVCVCVCVCLFFSFFFVWAGVKHHCFFFGMRFAFGVMLKVNRAEGKGQLGPWQAHWASSSKAICQNLPGWL